MQKVPFSTHVVLVVVAEVVLLHELGRRRADGPRRGLRERERGRGPVRGRHVRPPQPRLGQGRLAAGYDGEED